MNEIDLLKFLPAIYVNVGSPKTRYDILKTLGLSTSTQNYKKIDECIAMGFLKKKNSSPETFVADRGVIWDSWKKTPMGKKILDMISDNTIVPIG